ncbi:uncharacterized protein LOC131228764 [Magnolia sinica]|uniref:uncharacterized protein LOC131228764 n=1 Tax=Magnolia sinica TaxID=86752 RepID=UPI00265B6AD8|nr:uncharacterized protein LOC131228764 [Magnolia sinica]
MQFVGNENGIIAFQMEGQDKSNQQNSVSSGDALFLVHWKDRYLVPADLTVGQFVYVIRKSMNLTHEKAIFFFVKNILPLTGKEFETNFITSMMLHLDAPSVLD